METKETETLVIIFKGLAGEPVLQPPSRHQQDVAIWVMEGALFHRGDTAAKKA